MCPQFCKAIPQGCIIYCGSKASKSVDGSEKISFHAEVPAANIVPSEYLLQRERTIQNGMRCSSQQLKWERCCTTEYVRIRVTAHRWLCSYCYFSEDVGNTAYRRLKNMFDPWLMIAGDLVGYYYRYVLYSDLFEQRQLKQTYEERVIAATLRQFPK